MNSLRHLLLWLQAATGAVKGLQDEADTGKASSERLQQMVASLTADNLMFVMRLKKRERELQAASEERDELQLEVDEQRGPWLDEVSCDADHEGCKHCDADLSMLKSWTGTCSAAADSAGCSILSKSLLIRACARGDCSIVDEKLVLWFSKM